MYDTLSEGEHNNNTKKSTHRHTHYYQSIAPCLTIIQGGIHRGGMTSALAPCMLAITEDVL